MVLPFFENSTLCVIVDNETQELIMNKQTCPYCGKSYDVDSSCNCKCPHSTSGEDPICEECILEQARRMKPQPERVNIRECSVPLTRMEVRDLRMVLKKEMNG